MAMMAGTTRIHEAIRVIEDQWQILTISIDRQGRVCWAWCRTRLVALREVGRKGGDSSQPRILRSFRGLSGW